MPQPLTLAFVTTAFNESENLEELHRRCRAAHDELQREFVKDVELQFRLVVADNCSGDASPTVLKRLCQIDPCVLALANRVNYGAEVSGVNALRQSLDCDLIVLLCSDLQDPPELAVPMVRTLLQRIDVDAVLAVKKRSAGSHLLRFARRVYYAFLSYSTRQKRVPNGFHGFGCYRKPVIEETLDQWSVTDLSLRQCLVNTIQSPIVINYDQPDRLRGISSYSGFGYWIEGLRSILGGDAAASRLALSIGSAALLISLLLAFLLLLNYARGGSGYGGGVPTVMGLVLLSFAFQMMMFSVLSRQIESLRMGGFRPKVHFRRIGDDS